MSDSTTVIAPARGLSIGMDLGDQDAHLAVVTTDGEVSEEVRLKLKEPVLRSYFSRKPLSRVVLEVGTASPWVSRLLKALGHEVLVLNPHKLRPIAESTNKTDRVDALTLAELGRIGTRLVQTVTHHDEQVQTDLALLRSRSLIVQTRTKLINHIRSVSKSAGGRVRTCKADAFHRFALEDIPTPLKDILGPLVLQVANQTHVIRAYERSIAATISARYPQTLRLQKVHGVGPITALTFVLTIDDPGRFRRNRQVGKFLGLAPGVR